MFTGLVPVDSVSAGCANFCVLSEYDIGKVTGDLTGKIPQTLHVIGCLKSPVDLLKSVRDQENILVNQFHNHAQQLKVKIPVGHWTIKLGAQTALVFVVFHSLCQV